MSMQHGTDLTNTLNTHFAKDKRIHVLADEEDDNNFGWKPSFFSTWAIHSDVKEWEKTETMER